MNDLGHLSFGGNISKVKVTAGRRGGEGIHVDAGASQFIILVHRMKAGMSIFADLRQKSVSIATSLNDREKIVVLIMLTYIMYLL